MASPGVHQPAGGYAADDGDDRADHHDEADLGRRHREAETEVEGTDDQCRHHNGSDEDVDDEIWYQRAVHHRPQAC